MSFQTLALLRLSAFLYSSKLLLIYSRAISWQNEYGIHYLTFFLRRVKVQGFYSHVVFSSLALLSHTTFLSTSCSYCQVEVSYWGRAAPPCSWVGGSIGFTEKCLKTSLDSNPYSFLQCSFASKKKKKKCRLDLYFMPRSISQWVLNIREKEKCLFTASETPIHWHNRLRYR